MTSAARTQPVTYSQPMRFAAEGIFRRNQWGRGRAQGPGRGAEGEAVPGPVSCPGEAGQRTASADRVCAFARVAGACWCGPAGGLVVGPPLLFLLVVLAS